MSGLLDFRTSDEPRLQLVDSRDPRQVLARYLRLLREERWPTVKITQPQLAQALGGDRALSVPLISSWESATNPKIPPIPRLEAYATFFATERSVAEDPPRLLRSAEMTEPERQAKNEILRELMSLRKDAMRATEIPTSPSDDFEALSVGPWRFDDGKPVTIVCAQLPEALRATMPYADPADPNYVRLYNYSDLDSLVELHGHLRAANPRSQVNFRAAQRLVEDDYTTHLVSLGGVDWNSATSSLLDELRLPVRQVSADSPEDAYFQVEESDSIVQRRPRLEVLGERKILREDVALFARSINPYNRVRTVTICNGMYSSGSYGAVRALTDTRFRDRNAAYLQDRFGDSESFCILFRVRVERGAPLTPDWTVTENRLFEWSK
jgi:hypothetical protein